MAQKFVANSGLSASCSLLILLPIVSPLFAASPTILEQPVSQAVRQGEPVTLRVVASGTEPVAYQWHFAGVGDGSFVPLGSETNSTYSITSVTAADTGSYLCTVQSGQDTVYSRSAVVSLLTNLPNVSLTIVSPGNGATFQTPVNVPTTVTVTAAVSGEMVHRWVEFSANGSVIGVIGGTTSFTLNWSNVAVGEYTLQAASLELLSNAWVTFTSDPISISVGYGGFALIPPGSAWKYHDEGIALPADWKTEQYDDAPWLMGEAQLGYGDGDERTYLRYSIGLDTNFITTYFRRPFVVSDPVAYSNLQVRLLRDDGAVVYLNGVELFRDNMPEGNIDHFTVALRGLSYPEESTFYPTWVNPARLRAGTNIFAVELHQIIPFAGDASFDFTLIGNIPVPPPELKIVRGTTDILLSWPADFPGYKLQSAAPLPAASSGTIWNDVSAPLTTNGGEFRATIEPSGEQRFFRLSVD
jgi:hypothetical protein